MSEQFVGEAGEQDFDLLATIIRRSFLTVADRLGISPQCWPRHPSHYTSDDVRKELDEGTRFFLLEADGEPVGCVGLKQEDDRVFKIRRLAVLPEHRHQGYGRALMNRALGEAKALGAKRVDLGMIADDAGLRTWYETFGFREKETKQFDGMPFVVLFMCMDL